MILKNNILFLTIAFAASSLFAVNLFSTNSGFESAITPWNLYVKPSSGGAATASLDSIGVKFGKKYLKISVSSVSASTADSNWIIQLQEPTWSAKKNVQYTYSCWAKADSADRTIELSAAGDSTDEYTYRASKKCPLTTDWAFYQFPFVSDVAGTDKMHFFIFCGFSTGTFCFDSMALDSVTPSVQAKNHFTISNRNETFSYGVQLLPNCLRIVLGNPPSISNNVTIYSVGGRLLSSQNIPNATSTFEIPKPAPGAWVVDVNSNKKVIRIP